MAQSKVVSIYEENENKIFPKLILPSSSFQSSIKESIINTRIYAHSELPKITIPNNETENSMNIKVINMDCLEAHRIKIKEELKDDNGVLLVMGSDLKAGGGYDRQKTAQEEQICNKTILYHCLNDYERNKVILSNNNKAKKQKWYPLKPDDIIYTPKALVFRNVNNELLDEKEYYNCSFITCCAIRRPELDESGDYMYYEKDAKLMKEKWKAILRLAHLHKHKNVILSGLGNGVFACPPVHVAELLYDLVYNDPEFNQAFDNIFIAIIDPYLKTQNFKVYSEIFNKKEKEEKESTKEEEEPKEEKFSLSKSQRRRLRKLKLEEQEKNLTS